MPSFVRTRTARFGGLMIGTVLAIVAVSINPAGPAAASTALPNGATTPSSTGEPTPDQTLAHQLAVGIDALATSDISSTYGGVEIQPNQAGVTVFLTKATTSSEDKIRSVQTTAESRIPIVFTSTPTTVAQRDALQSRITSDVVGGYWKNQGLTVRSWGPDVESGTEIVEVLDAPATAAAGFAARYGGSVRVEAVTGQEGIVQTYSRRADSAPWNGGDYITDNSQYCTSGIPVHDSNHNYIITAGHCFSNGSSIFNGGFNGTNTFGSGDAMGSISDRDTGSGGVDAELQKVSSSDLLYTGGEGVVIRSIVSGRTANVVGDQVCVDGAYEFEVCGAVIKHISQCLTLSNGRYVCHITQAKRSDSLVVAGPGDSGGPLFEFSGSSLEVVGTVTGSYGDNHPCTTPENAGETCSTGVAYTETGPELDAFNVNLNTG